jgi:hypothetical protein
MYVYELHPEELLYVCSLSGGGDADADFSTHVEQLRAASAQVGDRVLRVVVRLRPGHPVPNARWRSRVGELMSDEGFSARLAVISSNPVIRGVLTAVSWVASRERVGFKMFNSLAAAQAWLAEETGAPLPDLEPVFNTLEGSGDQPAA